MKFRWLKTVILPGLLAVTPPFAAGEIAGSQLPDFGDSSGSLISPAQERELGEAFMRSVRYQAKLVSDPQINGYIRQLGDRLAANSDSPGYPFTFFVVEDGSVNAFAGPGGYIGVHTGLILAARNESELAGVLAHEIAHVTQRHLMRAYESASQLSLPTAAAMIAALVLGATTDSDAGFAAASAIQAGNIQYQLNFTRANEKEADRIGIQTLARSEIDTFGMPSFFEQLYQSTRLYGSSNVPDFLLTHPVTSDRIAESMQRAEQYGRGKKRDSLDFQLTRARLKVLDARDPQQILKEYETQAKKPSAGPEQRYGLALANWRVGNRSAAQELLLALLKDDPDRILYRTTLAQLQLESDQPQKALKLLEDTLSLYPGDLVVGEYYAAALIRAGKAEQARDQVRKMLRDEKARTPTVYGLWAKAASVSGPPWEAKQAAAELYFLNGNVPLAVDQLQQALRMEGLSQYEQASLQARLQEYKRAQADREKK
jgi:predicted Zn-dependent protease